MLQNWVANGANRPPWILGALWGDAGRCGGVILLGENIYSESLQLTYHSMGIG